MAEPPGDLEDDDPIVVLDDAPAVQADAGTAVAGLSQAAADYLTTQGVTSTATWAAFRLGQVSTADLHRLLTMPQRRIPRPTGMWLPTFDPRVPAILTGLIRLSPAQHKHAFTSRPVGLAGPVDLDRHRRVVLVNTPLLALHLHQLGVADVAVAEEPAVIPPLAEWFAAREVLVLAAKAKDLAAMITALGGTGRGQLISSRLDHLSDEVRGLLRIPAKPLAAPLPLDPRVVVELHAYAEGRLQTEAGMQALAAFDLDEPDVLRAYRVGYFPADMRMALTPDQRRMMQGRELGGCIVLPAFDAQGAVVDLVVHQVCNRGSALHSLWDTPRGLCAPAICTAYERICVTTVPRWVGRLFRSVGPTLLLRGVANAQAEGARLAAGGVRQAEVRCYTQAESDGIAEALRAVGITVRIVTDDQRRRPTAGGRRRGQTVAIAAPALPVATDAPAAAEDVAVPMLPAPVPVVLPGPARPEVTPEPVVEPLPIAPPAVIASLSLDLVSHDAQAEQAVFRYGVATYTVQLPWGASSTVEVALAVGTHQYRDRFDLAVAPQRLRFATAAGLRTKLPPADIATALELILPAMRRLVEVKPADVMASPVTGMSAADRDVAMAVLQDPAVVETFAAACDAMGWPGEPDAKLTVLLAAISRLGDEPVWAALTADAASERFPALGILAAITPPEHLLHVSRLTDNALFHGDRDALRHKLLLLDDLGGISPAVATALRVLHAQGVLTGTQVERDAVRGRMRTKQVQAQGPLAVVTASTAGIPAALAQHLVEVAVDESPAQAERLIAARQRAPVDAARIITRLMNAQRLLRPLPVVVPGEVAVPVIISRHRALHAPFFGLVAASALLHQHQRPVLDGRLVATAGDVALAQRAVLPLVGQVLSGLGVRAHAALVAIGRISTPSVTVGDLARLMPDWSAMTVRRAVDDLVAAGCLVTERRRNGVQASYRLVSPATGTGDLFSFSPPFQATCEGPSREAANG